MDKSISVIVGATPRHSTSSLEGTELNRFSWQLRTTLLIVAVIPPVTGIIATVAPQQFRDGFHFPRWESLASLLFTTTFLTVPLSYVFGIVPALIGGVIYCTLLTKVARFRYSLPYRCALGFVVGASAAGLSCYFLLGAGAIFYSLICGIAALLFATRWPANEASAPLTIGSSDRGGSIFR
jgi:hypothetical protein